MKTLSSLAVLALATNAFAQEPEPPPPPPPPPVGGPGIEPAATAPAVEAAPVGVGPILPNMLPARIGPTFDVRADYTQFPDDDLFGDLFLMAITLHAQYIAPEGYGGYITLPYFISRSDEVDQLDDTGAGNLEVGGLYVVDQGESNKLLLRGGLALDSAGQIGGILAPFSQIGPRLYDAYPTGLQRMWGRAEASYRISQGNVHLAASAAADVPLTSPDEDEFSGDFDLIVKGAVSAGIDAGGASFGIGFALLHAVGTEGEDDDDTLTVLNVVGAFPINPTMSLYAAFGLPDLENNADEFDIWGLGAGLRATIR